MANGRSLKVELQSEDLPPPEAVNFFNLSRVGTDVQLMAGYLDLHKAAVALQEAQARGGEPKQLKAEATHRLVMGAQAFAMLKAQVDIIAAAMQQDGSMAENPMVPPSGTRR
jgi:hypothetical protein